MLHPSLTMWCMPSSSTCSSSASRSSDARKSGPAARSNGAARLLGRALRASPPRARPRAAPTGPRPGARSRRTGAITCTGAPSASAERGPQRLVAAHDLAQGALQRRGVQRARAAAAPRACCTPCSPAAAGPGTTAAPARRRAAAALAAPRGPPAASAGTSAAAQLLHAPRPAAATVGPRTGRAGAAPRRTPRAPARPPAWPAASARPGRRSCRARRRASSAQHLRPDPGQHLLHRRARRHVRSAPAGAPGAGSARRSSLPLGVRGSRVQDDERGRHHVLRQAAAQVRAQLVRRPPPPPRTPPAAARPARPRAATTAHSRTPGCRRSAASISPGSMRKPRIFTCSSRRPRYSSAPPACQRTRSPVRYSRAPGSAANGSGTKRSAVSAGRPR